jgi:hypothetical protein
MTEYLSDAHSGSLVRQSIDFLGHNAVFEDFLATVLRGMRDNELGTHTCARDRHSLTEVDMRAAVAAVTATWGSITPEPVPTWRVPRPQQQGQGQGQQQQQQDQDQGQGQDQDQGQQHDDDDDVMY